MGFLNIFKRHKSKLVNMQDMLAKAAAGHYAVPAININNLE
ncbi:MAG: class II fructose-bisphosphate aldolase [Mycoplasmoidaceae bacterium]|nr:class II fructose-bisphosphate aldolase [Mycoplasmoidaceae bacterium]